MQKTTQRKKKKPSRIPLELVDELLEDYQKPEDLLGSDGLLKKLVGALVNRAMQAEMDTHLGYSSGAKPSEEQSNRRNGTSPKMLRSNHGDISINVPRDRESSFEPELVKKHQRHFDGFDDKILSMYARGMSTRDIRAHLEEIYGVEISPTLISTVTDAIVDELRVWQQRPLERIYAFVYVDALVVKIRDKGAVRNKSVHLVIGVDLDGQKTVLGMWLNETEGAKFWLAVLNELRQRGTEDILILCADGLTGMSDAVQAAFPKTIFQTCIVHLIRNSTRFVPWKERKELCADLKKIYTATNSTEAKKALDEFSERWDSRFPMISESWKRRWEEIIPFLEFSPEIRRAIYTTNAIEALNRQIRKVIKTKGHLPSDEAAKKLIFMALRNAEKTWGKPHHSWNQARLQLAIHFGERIS